MRKVALVKSQAPNPKLQIPGSKSQAPNRKLQLPSSKILGVGTWQLGFGIWDLGFGILFILLDDLLQPVRHRRNRNTRHLHPAAASATHRDVERGEGGALVWIVLAEMTAAAFLAFDGGACDRLRHGQQVAKVLSGVPAGVVFTMADDAGAGGAAVQLLQPDERLLHLALVADDADQVLHHRLQVLLDLERVLRGIAALERLERAFLR